MAAVGLFLTVSKLIVLGLILGRILNVLVWLEQYCSPIW